MVEVFITDIKKQVQAKRMIETLEPVFPELRFNYDMDETELSFPMGHTVLRVEGKNIDAEQIISIVKKLGANCEIMKDIVRP